jgi:hypothetical protein
MHEFQLVSFARSNFKPRSIDLQVVEPFTVHYAFALGIVRFLSCAHWILHVNFPYIVLPVYIPLWLEEASLVQVQ